MEIGERRIGRHQSSIGIDAAMNRLFLGSEHQRPDNAASASL
jgi:hypothetical protein